MISDQLRKQAVNVNCNHRSPLRQYQGNGMNYETDSKKRMKSIILNEKGLGKYKELMRQMIEVFYLYPMINGQSWIPMTRILFKIHNIPQRYNIKNLSILLKFRVYLATQNLDKIRAELPCKSMIQKREWRNHRHQEKSTKRGQKDKSHLVCGSAFR